MQFFLPLFLTGLCYCSQAQSVTGSGTNGTCPANASITAAAGGFAGNAIIGYQLYLASTQVRPSTPGQFQTSNIFGSLPAGTYTIKATDQNNYVTATSENITLGTSYVPMGLSNTMADVTCFGAATGQITTGVTGGSGAKTFALSGMVSRTAQPSNIFLNLPAGNYTVAVTDACSQTQTINSSVGLDTLSVNGIIPLFGFGITYATPGNCASGLVVKQQSYTVYSKTQGTLSAKDFLRFTWKYEYPAGSGNFYGAGGALNGAAVSLNNATNSTIPMPAGVTAAGKAIQPVNVVIYDECGNTKAYSAAINYTLALLASNCAGTINVSSAVSAINNYQPICLPVNFTFTDKAAPFTVINAQQTTVQQTLRPGLVAGHTYSVTATDQNNGNTVYSSSNFATPAIPAQTATISPIPSTCEANKSILRIIIKSPSPIEQKTFTITSAPASAGLNLPASYSVGTAGSYYALPGTFPDGSYTVEFQTDCNAFAITDVITGHTVSLNTLNTIANCGSFNLTGTAAMDNYALYEMVILPGSASNTGLIRSFNSNGASLPFTGLSYGRYDVGIRLKGSTCMYNSLSATFTAPASPLDITSATGYVCSTIPSTTAALIIDAVSNVNSPLYYSIDDGASYGPAGMDSFTVAYGSNGKIKVKVRDDCGNIASYAGDLTIPPTAKATANSTASDASICEGKPVQLTVNIIHAGYHWTGPNGFTSTLNSPLMPAFVAANNGTYSVVVTTVCGVQSSSVAITALALPEMAQTTGNFTTCKNSTTQLANAVTGGVWRSSNISIATVSSTGLVTGMAAGSAVITYTTAPNGNACTSAAVSNLTVNPVPVGVVTGTVNVNAGDVYPSVTFTGSNGTAPFTFTYNINGSTDATVSTTTGNSVTVSQPTTTPGTFKYNLLNIQDHSSTSCSTAVTGSATITVNTLLPVVLERFEAMVKDTRVLLAWSTAREMNNGHYVVERSADGITFSPLGSVAGYGTSAEKHDYRFTDSSPVRGENYYRLKQFDINGKWTFSRIVSLRFTGMAGLSAAPNPASGMAMLHSPPGSLSLFDLNGKALLNEKRTGGTYYLPVQGYPTGSYLIRLVQDNGKISTVKLQVQH